MSIDLEWQQEGTKDDIETGLWCDTCLLSSGVCVPGALYDAATKERVIDAPLRACADCGGKLKVKPDVHD